MSQLAFSFFFCLVLGFRKNLFPDWDFDAWFAGLPPALSWVIRVMIIAQLGYAASTSALALFLQLRDVILALGDDERLRARQQAAIEERRAFEAETEALRARIARMEAALQEDQETTGECSERVLVAPSRPPLLRHFRGSVTWF